MSFTRLRYHVVTSTKRRMPLITNEIEALIYQVFRRAAEENGARVIAIGGVEDHVHVILACPPNRTLSDIVGAMKSRASRKVNSSEEIDTDFVWQKGYSAFTLRAWDYHRALVYVENQKSHHAADSLIPLLEPE